MEIVYGCAARRSTVALARARDGRRKGGSDCRGLEPRRDGNDAAIHGTRGEGRDGAALEGVRYRAARRPGGMPCVFGRSGPFVQVRRGLLFGLAQHEPLPQLHESARAQDGHGAAQDGDQGRRSLFHHVAPHRASARGRHDVLLCHGADSHREGPGHEEGRASRDAAEGI